MTDGRGRGDVIQPRACARARRVVFFLKSLLAEMPWNFD
jgi:hypothetical protein